MAIAPRALTVVVVAMAVVMVVAVVMSVVSVLVEAGRLKLLAQLRPRIATALLPWAAVLVTAQPTCGGGGRPASRASRLCGRACGRCALRARVRADGAVTL